MKLHRFRAFGLTIAASRTLPALESAIWQDLLTDADITISEGEVPAFAPSLQLLEMGIARHDDRVLVDVPDVGRFAISAFEIIVDRSSSATDAEVDAYLLGTAMGAIMHLRGILPLHCNAFASDGRVALICGASGAGKSTLAAHFRRRGREILTDDLCAVVSRDGTFLAHPGIPRLKLWSEAVAHLGLDDRAARPVPWNDGKVELAAEPGRFRPLPISSIYVLPREVRAMPEGPRLRPLVELDALNAITSNIYRRAIADVIGDSAGYLGTSVMLARSVPIFAFERQWGLDSLEAQADELLDHFERGQFLENS